MGKLVTLITPLARPVAAAQRIPTQKTAPEVLRANENGHLAYVIPAIDPTAYNQLGPIITRVDANGGSDPVGEYTIVLSAGGGGD
jgi:hypothetical protein